MKTYKLLWLLGLIVCMGLLMFGCEGEGEGLPDLVVKTLETMGPATLNPEGEVEVHIRVVVRNQGDDKADIFKVATFYNSTTLGGPLGVAFNVSGQGYGWYPSTSEVLAPGDDVTFEGIVTFIQHGMTVSLWAEADSCAGDEFMPDYCRVEESNEENNDSTPISVSLPFPSVPSP